MEKLYLLGVGHNTPGSIDLAESCGYEVAGLYHYNNERTGELEHGFKILGSFDDLFNKESLSGMNFQLTMGDNNIRAKLCKRIIKKGGNIPSLIHPMSIISHFAKISPIGVYIYPFTFIDADTEIGDCTVILSHVHIAHNNTIGQYCFISCEACIGAYTNMEDFVFVGQGGLSISSKVKMIGHHAYIGANALLTHDVLPYQVLAGSPARVIRVLQ